MTTKDEEKTREDLKKKYPNAYCDISECTNDPNNPYVLKSRQYMSNNAQETTHNLMLCDDCYEKVIKGKLIPRPQRNFNEFSKNNPMPNNQRRRRRY